jgi:fatty acid desaturase
MSQSATLESEPHWISRAAFQVISLVLALGQVLLWLALRHQWWWLAVPLILAVSHLMHGQLIGFHEASHGMLRKNRGLNEIDGLFIGVFSLMSFTLYRAAHQTHHVHLSTERDEEFWPFVQPGTPRAFRLLAAFLELFLGLFWTRFIFLRTFLRAGSPVRSPRVRRRIWAELVLMTVVWGVLLAVVAWQHWWTYLIGMYAVPAWIAGNLQSWRKYIEHVGLAGSTPTGSTRSIVADTFWGNLVSFTLLHEPFHGVHHQHAGVSHAYLSRHVESLAPAQPGEHPPFPSYRHALADLLRGLADPKVGAQWGQ